MPAPAPRLPHEYERLDPAVRRELLDDLGPGTAILYLPPGSDPDLVVLAMHPRADFSRHYLASRLAAAGYAFAGAPTRHLNNDADAVQPRWVSLSLSPSGVDMKV